MKQSGWGRELGQPGLDNYLVTKVSLTAHSLRPTLTHTDYMDVFEGCTPLLRRCSCLADGAISNFLLTRGGYTKKRFQIIVSRTSTSAFMPNIIIIAI